MHILRGFVRCPWCGVVGPPASVTLAMGAQERRVRCVACGEWHVVADAATAMLTRDMSVVCPYCRARVGCPKTANVVRCDPQGGSGCGRLFAGPAQSTNHRAAARSDS